jgi:hypothetical protein
MVGFKIEGRNGRAYEWRPETHEMVAGPTDGVGLLGIKKDSKAHPGKEEWIGCWKIMKASLLCSKSLQMSGRRVIPALTENKQCRRIIRGSSLCPQPNSVQSSDHDQANSFLIFRLPHENERLLFDNILPDK